MRPGSRCRTIGGMTRTPFSRGLVPLLAATAVLLSAASAQAGTVALEGDALVFRAAPGESNNLFINDEGAEIVFSDAEAYPITVGAGCTHSEYDPASTVRCSPAGSARAELGDGDDVLRIGFGWKATAPVSADGGPGNDALEGGEESDALVGGDGDDTIKGGAGDDALDGAGGNDKLDGGNGHDVLRGGDGDDTLAGDPGASMAPDVLDGGNGRDTLSEYEYSDGGSSQRPVRVTLDAGGADDGRPGEGDEITGVEVVHLLVAADLTAGAAGADLKVFHTQAAPSRLTGGPGNDVLTGYDYDDVINGGPGDDMLIGAYGHDTIVGGPGRDTVNADAVDGCNFLECRPIYGNDVIDVRDGEVDTVACGPGTDKVTADADDVIAPDCETVERAAAGTPPGGTTPSSKNDNKRKTTKKLAVSVPKALAARSLKSRTGRTLKVTVPAKGKLTLTLARGKAGKGGTAATGATTAKAAGGVSVRLRAKTPAQRRRLTRGTYRLTVRFTPSAKGAKATRLTKTIKLK